MQAPVSRQANKEPLLSYSSEYMHAQRPQLAQPQKGAPNAKKQTRSTSLLRHWKKANLQ